MNEKNVPILDSEQLADRIYNSVKKREGERFCFILGSGACVTSGIPSGGELEYQWMRELMGELPVNGHRFDCERTEKLAERFWSAPFEKCKFNEIVDHWNSKKLNGETTLDGKYYFDIFDLREFITQQNGQRLLESLLEGDKVFPSYGYITLARLLADGSGSNLVLTTNFDNLVERALYMYTNAVPITINHEALAAFIDEPNLKRPLIGKIHRGSCFGMLNKPQEIDGLQGNWEKILNDIFLTYTPIVIGYSGNDKSLMSYLESHTLKHGIIWCVHKDLPSDKRIWTAVRKSNGCFVLHNGFDNLMIKIGNLIFEDELKRQNVVEMLEQRCKGYQEKITRSFSDATEKAEDDAAAAELKSKTEEEDAKREIEGTLTAMDYFFRAYEFVEQKDYRGAIVNYTKAIKLDPKFAAAYNNRGAAYADIDKYDDAMKDYNKAIELDPKYVAAYNNRGNAYANKGNNDDAIKDYNKAIELDPKDADYYNNRGDTYAKMGRLEEALKDCNQALEIDPNCAEAYDSRGFTYEKLGELKKALADYNKALELNPDLTETKENRDRVLALLRKKKQ